MGKKLPKLQVKNLQISFRTQQGILKAVRDISFDLEEGETLAIVGESGSGKSVTSKAIIGILAGNSIVEGGEILYDGQDLLRISEDNFHKIRGDKISMIFQDPLSSLNPIMRVGKQLTEAMILNGKAKQKNATRGFEEHYRLLVEALDLSRPDKKQENAELMKIFREFMLVASKMEKEYADAQAATIDLSVKIDDTLFLLSKNQPVDVHKVIVRYLKDLEACYHPFVVAKNERFEEIFNSLSALAKEKKVEKDVGVQELSELSALLHEAESVEHPDYFSLAYYIYTNPSFDYSGKNKAELDALTGPYLEENFMRNFVEVGSEAEKYVHGISIENKQTAIPLIKEIRDYLENNKELDRKKLLAMLNMTDAAVKNAQDRLRIRKHSIEFTFGVSMRNEINRFFKGLKNNPKNQARYDRQKAKWDHLVQIGKNPTWQVIPPHLIDLDLTRVNMIKICNNLLDRYERTIRHNAKYNKELEMSELVAYFKEQAAAMVHSVTKGIAKAHALKLLGEVGIPEPRIRYRQYPFEFSGGMRQRIVIAIALSANPDILICDEPTTALDVTIQSQILELINKIKKERNLSVIFITHDLGVVANMADRVAVMYAGKIVEYGTADEVFYDPRHPYTWALLASMPDLDTKDKLEAIPGTPPNMIYPPVGDAFADRNKYAMKIDFEKQPPLFEITPTHFAATWLLHPNAPKVEPPKLVTERIARMKKAKEESDHE